MRGVGQFRTLTASDGPKGAGLMVTTRVLREEVGGMQICTCKHLEWGSYEEGGRGSL